MAKNSRKNITLGWGSGETDLFLAPSKNGNVELLDYEFDYEKIHQMCGGRLYYRSCSGASGTGYIKKWGELTRVGYYRVDTAYNEWQYPVKLSEEEEVSIMLPYQSHTEEKDDILENNPVVIRVGRNTLVYCHYYDNMREVLSKLLAGEKLEEEPRTLTRTFVDVQRRYERVVELKFYDFFGWSFNPWEFVTDLFAESNIAHAGERLYELFHLAKCENGMLVSTTRIAGALYASKILEQDPCKALTESIAGWKVAGSQMAYRLYENEVHIVGWEDAETAYGKRIERVARFIPDAEKESFRAFLKENLNFTKYVEFEIVVPKLLFFLNKEKQYAEVKKGIARKIREDVFCVAKNWQSKVNDEKLLEAIPDDLVVTIADSHSSGNCVPGTQAFVDQYFPGKTETTAGELKKYSDKWEVMRVFRYIAKRDQIVGKVKLDIPA